MLESTASACGMSRKGRRWSPSPACSARCRSDHFGYPVLLGAKGRWKCQACGVGGDEVALASLFLGGPPAPSGRAYWDAKRFIDKAAGVAQHTEQPEEEKPHLPVAELLRSVRTISRVSDPVLDAFLTARKIKHDAPAAWVPSPPKWFPMGYPLVVPAFTGRGELFSMHGRKLVPCDPDKRQAWPRGGSVGLLLDPKWARPWARGGTAPARVLLTEGLTDYLSSAPDRPTIGVTNGCFDALRLLAIPRDTEVYCAMHPDAAGDIYEGRLADAIWPAVARPLPLERLL